MLNWYFEHAWNPPGWTKKLGARLEAVAAAGHITTFASEAARVHTATRDTAQVKPIIAGMTDEGIACGEGSFSFLSAFPPSQLNNKVS
jgi:hypothetical protein